METDSQIQKGKMMIAKGWKGGRGQIGNGDEIKYKKKLKNIKEYPLNNDKNKNIYKTLLSYFYSCLMVEVKFITSFYVVITIGRGNI